MALFTIMTLVAAGVFFVGAGISVYRRKGEQTRSNRRTSIMGLGYFMLGSVLLLAALATLVPLLISR